MSDSKKSAKTKQEWIQGVQQDARHRVINRGMVHFRLNPELMELLCEISEYKQVGAGILARMWVVERLRQEAAELRQPHAARTGSPAGQSLAESPAKYRAQPQQPAKPGTVRKSKTRSS